MCTFGALDGNDVHTSGAGFFYFFYKTATQSAFLEQDGISFCHIRIKAQMLVGNPLLMGQEDATFTIQDTIDDLNTSLLQPFQLADALHACSGQ